MVIELLAALIFGMGYYAGYNSVPKNQEGCVQMSIKEMANYRGFDDEIVEPTRVEVIRMWRKAASDLSYYNAAEGDAWRKESSARMVAAAALGKASDLAKLYEIPYEELRGEGCYLI